MKDLGYGIWEIDGKKYALTQDAYYETVYGEGVSRLITEPESGKWEYYTAKAVDENGKTYQFYWKITNPDAEHEDEMCDWGDVYEVKEIEY